eukprot:39276-Hanusia_phi.AAC.1
MRTVPTSPATARAGAVTDSGGAAGLSFRSSGAGPVRQAVGGAAALWRAAAGFPGPRRRPGPKSLNDSKLLSVGAGSAWLAIEAFLYSTERFHYINFLNFDVIVLLNQTKARRKTRSK